MECLHWIFLEMGLLLYQVGAAGLCKYGIPFQVPEFLDHSEAIRNLSLWWHFFQMGNELSPYHGKPGVFSLTLECGPCHRESSFCSQIRTPFLPWSFLQMEP